MVVKKIAYVVPCYNEEEVIEEFYRRVAAVARSLPEFEFEFMFVNDGSSDTTPIKLNALAEVDQRVKVIHLARNLGHQIALTTGLDYCDGDMIITIDADLQDPPELAVEFKEKLEQGFDVVHAQRSHREGETAFKLATARLFYKFMKSFGSKDLVENSGDFRAFNRKVLLTMRCFREHHRFLRGMFASIGFKQTVIEYRRAERFAGQTKYPFWKMFHFATDAVLSFSAAPIRFIAWLSMALWLASLVYLAWSLYEHFFLGSTITGWTSIIFLTTVFTGLILFTIGIVATYIGRIFEELKDRPLYWIKSWRNIGPQHLQNETLTPREKALSALLIDQDQKPGS